MIDKENVLKGFLKEIEKAEYDFTDEGIGMLLAKIVIFLDDEK